MLELQISSYLRHFNDKQTLKPVRCDLCGQPGHLRWHGTYSRRLMAFTKGYTLPIRRLFCTLCRHTFALLPAFIAKFHRYAVEVIRSSMVWLKTSTLEAVAERLDNLRAGPEGPPLATLTLYLWRRKFGQRLHL